MDLAEPDLLDDKIARVLAHHDPLRRGLGLPKVDPAALREELLSVAPRILPFMDAVWELLEDNRRAGKRILFEGAQGVLLDVDHGTYPYVTSSNTVAASAASGSGLGPAPSAMCSASPRPIRRASAAGRFRPSFMTRSAS